jgi:hypothetical protein
MQSLDVDVGMDICLTDSTVEGYPQETAKRHDSNMWRNFVPFVLVVGLVLQLAQRNLYTGTSENKRFYRAF